MDKSLTPKAWRSANRLSLAKAALAVGVTGRNPARTWQRWEQGAAEPPIQVVVALEELSFGQVTARSWAEVRMSYVSRPCGIAT